MGRLLVLLSSLLLTVRAQARVYDTYRADSVKGAFCSTIGGACASDIDFDSAPYQNPATLTAGEGNWDYDWDLIKKSSLEPKMQLSNDVKESVYNGFVAFAGTTWGVGLSLTYQTDEVHSRANVTDDNGQTQTVDLVTKVANYAFHLPVSYRYSKEWSLGMALTLLTHHETLDLQGNVGEASVTPEGPAYGVSIGAIYMPNDHYRFGSWFRTSISYFEQINIHARSFGNDLTYSEQAQLHSPWVLSSGLSWMPWGDPRTLFADLKIVGWTYHGYLLAYDNFTGAINEEQLYEKGRRVVVEPRVGWRSPWYVGSHGSYMAGAYLERGRTEGSSDRPHATGGIAYKIPFQLGIIDGLEFMFGMDVAKNFQQLFFTYR